MRRRRGARFPGSGALRGGVARLASHLAQLAGDAEPTNPEIHAARRDVFATRSHAELSLMARAIFGSAARESQAALDALDPTPAPVEDN